MKRSEMENKIFNIISEVCYPELAIKRAKRILEMMEKEGMSPPRYNIKHMEEQGFPSYYENISEWEPENE